MNLRKYLVTFKTNTSNSVSFVKNFSVLWKTFRKNICLRHQVSFFFKLWMTARKLLMSHFYGFQHMEVQQIKMSENACNTAYFFFFYLNDIL